MKKSVLLETSARHAHVSRRVLDILFGEGYELTHKKDRSQPGQFATNERISCLLGVKLRGHVGVYLEIAR